MAQVNVTIAGKAYRMACGDGEEAHLEGLAGALDAKIAEMRGTFGEIGDMRLHVMAALMIADEASELAKRVATLERRLDTLSQDAGQADARISEAEERAAQALVTTAERIEGIARVLLPTQAG